MGLVTRPEDIWVLTPTKEDLFAGAKYAAVTLPWTFNRMMLNTGSAGQQGRALNIAKGIVAQEMLRRKLTDKGIDAPTQTKSYRDEDLFDFDVRIGGVQTKLDVKSINYFTNYAGVDREPLTRELIIRNAGYGGPDWRRFFPMLVPHTQIEQGKEAYCFGIASSIDFRRDIGTNRVGYAMTAFPYGEPMGFLASKKLCIAREAAGAGFYVKLRYVAESMLGAEAITVTVLGEWAGKPQRVALELAPGAGSVEAGPFSCVSAVNMKIADYRNLYGRIEVAVDRNEFTTPVRNTLRVNTNVPYEGVLVLRKEDFCNLVLPSDYTLYVIGWIRKDEFLEKCRKYTGWVWPKDSENKYENQAWAQITESDEAAITRAGFGPYIGRKPSRVNAGWMKTNGRGGGACCYVFPNVGSRGGVKETNLYVLPQDLHRMDDLEEVIEG